MARFLTNDKAIQAAKPRLTDYKINDGGGLFLLVKSNGSKLWRYRYKVTGKENSFALGEHTGSSPPGESADARTQRIAGGVLSLAEARIERDRAAGLVAQGIARRCVNFTGPPWALAIAHDRSAENVVSLGVA